MPTCDVYGCISTGEHPSREGTFTQKKVRWVDPTHPFLLWQVEKEREGGGQDD
jgi:hypothetical protein